MLGMKKYAAGRQYPFKLNYQGSRRGRDRVIVGFTTTCAMPITTDEIHHYQVQVYFNKN
jgi:hypothetical protein